MTRPQLCQDTTDFQDCPVNTGNFCSENLLEMMAEISDHRNFEVFMAVEAARPV